MKVFVKNSLKKEPLYAKQLDMGDRVELQLGPNTVLLVTQGCERMTVEVRSRDGYLEIVPIVSNNIVVRVKK